MCIHHLNATNNLCNTELAKQGTKTEHYTILWQIVSKAVRTWHKRPKQLLTRHWFKYRVRKNVKYFGIQNK